MQTSDLYDSVTRSIIADLEKGAVPWVKPWKGGNSGGIMPINAATRRYYTGINVLILWSARDEHDYPCPQWMTFKQALDKDGYVRKGEKGTPVIFAKKLTFNEGDEDERKVFMHRSFTVFNVAQIEELPKEEVSETIITEDAASTFIAATSADIRVGGDMAGYIPSKDYITLPPAAAFRSMGSYYATILHELGHWSGHESRPSGNSRPALVRNLTPPRNLSPSLRLHFCAPNSACRVNCGIAATSTIGSSSSKVIRVRSSPPQAKHPRRRTICTHSRRRGMKYLVLDNKRYLWRDILKLRREQRKAAINAQPALFELRDDERPKSQSKASSRYKEPTLFE